MFILLLWGHLGAKHLFVKTAVPITDEDLKFLFPEAKIFKEYSKPYPHYKVYGTEPQPIGIVWRSSDIVPDIKGYGGHIDLLIAMNLKGYITGLKIIDHNETPSYFKPFLEKDFLKRFINMSCKNSFTIGEDVDTISRATVSLSCICRTLRKSSQIMASQVLNLPTKKAESGKAIPWKRISPVFALCILTLIALVTEWKILRDFVLISALVYLGWIWPRWLAMTDLIQLSSGQWPQGEITIIWFIILGMALVLTPIWGRVFCGYLCPFGAFSEFVGRFLAWARRPWRNGQNDMTGIFLSINPATEAKWKKTKIFIAFIIWGVCFSLWKLQGPSVEPFDFIFIGAVPESRIFLFLIFLILFGSIFIPRFYCRYLCPVGGILSLLLVWKPRGEFKTSSCNECQSCVDICPVGAIQNNKILDSGECIGCNACRRVCKNRTNTIASNVGENKDIVLSIENWKLKEGSEVYTFEVKQGEWLEILIESNILFRSIINPKLKESGEIKVKPSSIGILYDPIDLGWSHRTVIGELETDPINGERILKEFNLLDKAKQDPFTLSYEEKWLLGLAKLAVINPPLLLLHGVFDGLDNENTSWIKNILSNLLPQSAIIYTTCNTEDI